MVLESKLLLSAGNTRINIQFLEFPFLMKYKVFKRGKESKETMSLSTAFKVALCHLPDAMSLAAPHRPRSCGCLDRNISLQDTSNAPCISVVPGVILAKPPSHPSIEMDNAFRVTGEMYRNVYIRVLKSLSDKTFWNKSAQQSGDKQQQKETALEMPKINYYFSIIPNIQTGKFHR